MNNYFSIEKNLKNEYSILKSKKGKISNFRLITFIISVFLFSYYLFTTNDLMLYTSSITFIIFIIFIVKASKITSQINYIKQALEILKQIKEDTTIDLFSEDNILYNNVYNKDLDIIEGKSIFNKINKTQTKIGNNQLKKFLSNLVLDKNEILERQSSFTEIGEKPEWIVKFLTLTKRLNMNNASVFTFDNNLVQNQFTKYLPIATGIINTAILLGLAIVGFPKELVFFWIIGAFIFSFIIQYIFRNKLATINAYSNLKTKELNNLYEVFNHIEKETFRTKNNTIIQNTFKNECSASKQIKDIVSTKETLDAATFPLIGFILNTFFLWRLYYSIQFENELRKTVHLINPWLDSLAIMEAYVSFAIFNDKNKNFSFPKISDNPFRLEIINGYHPLLDESIAVKNSFENNKSNNIAIITGANMAGKSTFLRTIGCNLVLAMNGAKVSAEKMCFFPMNLFTSIRTVDNLSSGDSYFKNEINKLKILIDRLEKGEAQYIILDEILKGTNSKDKLIGSRKFLEKLINTPTKLIGFIATHDLELTKMEEQFPENVINYSFELKNENNNYYSDYKLRKGTTQMMNAIFLMKQFRIID